MDLAGQANSSADSRRIAAEVLGLDRGTYPFVAAVRATRMPMIITNPRLPDNMVVFANDSFCRLSGYLREEIQGRNRRFLQGPETDPEAAAKIHDAVVEMVALQRQFPRARMSFRTNIQLTHAAAAQTGAGIALLPHYVGKADS